jgi:hypothetical protein
VAGVHFENDLADWREHSATPAIDARAPIWYSGRYIGWFNVPVARSASGWHSAGPFKINLYAVLQKEPLLISVCERSESFRS